MFEILYAAARLPCEPLVEWFNEAGTSIGSIPVYPLGHAPAEFSDSAAEGTKTTTTEADVTMEGAKTTTTEADVTMEGVVSVRMPPGHDSR